MPAFAQALKDVAARVPETEVLMIIGTDGIPIEKLTLRADPNIEASPPSTRRCCARASRRRPTPGSARCASSPSRPSG